MRRCVLIGTLLLSLVMLPGQAKADQGDLVVDLTLHGAVFSGDKPGAGDPSLLLDLRRTDGRWERVWGIARDFNIAMHPGRVAQARLDDGRVTLHVEMDIASDAWTRGGLARYEVTLEREDGAQDRYVGTFTGMFRHTAVTGRASAIVNSPAAGRSAEALAQRPRILFSADDLPELRRKAATPFGKAAIERFHGPLGLAMKYQLTGDAELAQQAKDEASRVMADTSNGDKINRARIWGHRLEQIALAYDLCYDAWDEAFKAQVREYLLMYGMRVFYSPGLFHKEISWRVDNDYAPAIWYGGAMAGLALWGEQGPAPTPPSEPFIIRQPDGRIAAMSKAPADGIPINDYTDTVMPLHWLFAGGFARGAGITPLQHLGGKDAMPKPGEEAITDEHREAFAAIDPQVIWQNNYTGGRPQLNITQATDRRYFTTNFFHTVIRNDQPRWARFTSGHGGAAVWINGTPVEDGAVVRLDKGDYALLVSVEIGETNPWGVIAMEPRFHQIAEDEARTLAQRTNASYQRALDRHRFEHEQWEQLGGVDQRFQRLFELSRLNMRTFGREVLGEGGFMVDTFAGMDGPNRYALAYQRMFGRPLTASQDLELYVPARMFIHRFDADGQAAVQEANGKQAPGFQTAVYIEKNRDVLSEFVAPLYLLTPEAMRPAVMWWWRQHTGAAEADDHASILKTSPTINSGTINPHAVYAFLAYDPEAPASPPAEVMPLTWEAPGSGFFGFRNRWQDQDDFVVQVYAHAMGGQHAGGLRVAGLGQLWSHREGLLPTGRFAENVVQLPGVDHNEGADGRVTHVERHADGSGVVSIDLSDVYSAPVSIGDPEAGRTQSLYESYGRVRRDVAFADSGVSGTRSIGIDFSGKSGVPCMIAIVDRIDGDGPKRMWAWQLDASRQTAGQSTVLDGDENLIEWQGVRVPRRVGSVIRDNVLPAPSDPAITIADGTFSLARADHTMHAHFIHPANPTLTLGERQIDRQAHKRNVSRHSSRAVFAQSDDHTFVILTFHAPGSDVPQVRVSGEGLDAVVTVGGQTVRFDGSKVVFGRP